jgi:predicted dehydrogenase
MKSINWGIIGCGDVTEIKSGPAFNLVPDSKLVAVMRRTESKVKDYAERHKVPKWYTNADELINDKDVNAVYVATPPSSHAEYTIKAAEAGKPVYVEKPMAASYEECRKMLEVCSVNNVPLFVAYYRRELSYFKIIKELVDSGIIGRIQSINMNLLTSHNYEDFSDDNLPWRVNPEIAGAGYFYDLAAHQFDYLDYVFGRIIKVSGYKSNFGGFYEAEDTVTASFIFDNNVIGTGHWCFVADKNSERDSTIVYGEKGRIEFSFFSPNPIIVYQGNEKHIYEIPYEQHVQEPLIKTVVAELLGKGKCMSTGESGSRANWVMDKILRKL